MPAILTHIHALCFQPGPAGICKSYDLVSRRPPNTDMPWWSLPETMRAAAHCAGLAADARTTRRGRLRLWGVRRIPGRRPPAAQRDRPGGAGRRPDPRAAFRHCHPRGASLRRRRGAAVRRDHEPHDAVFCAGLLCRTVSRARCAGHRRRDHRTSPGSRPSIRVGHDEPSSCGVRRPSRRRPGPSVRAAGISAQLQVMTNGGSSCV